MSPPANRARFLSPNQVSELVCDSESEEAGAPSDSFPEDKGGFEDACNRTTQHPVVKRPVHYSQVPLMKRKFFREGQASTSKRHSFRRGHSRLALREV